MEENQEDRTERKQWQCNGYLKNLNIAFIGYPKVMASRGIFLKFKLDDFIVQTLLKFGGFDYLEPWKLLRK